MLQDRNLSEKFKEKNFGGNYGGEVLVFLIDALWRLFHDRLQCNEDEWKFSGGRMGAI